MGFFSQLHRIFFLLCFQNNVLTSVTFRAKTTEKLLYLFMHSNFRQATYSIYGVTVINYYDAVLQKIGVSNEDALKIRKALQKRLGDN